MGSRYGASQRTGSIRVMAAIPTEIRYSLQDGKGNDKTSFIEDEKMRWYVLLLDTTKGVGVPNQTISLANRQSPVWQKTTGSDGYAVFDMQASEWNEIGTIVGNLSFAGGGGYAPASRDVTFSIAPAVTLATQIGYAIEDSTGAKRDEFLLSESTWWIAQLVTLADQKAVPGATIKIGKSINGVSAIWAQAVTGSDGFISRQKIAASTIGVGVTTWIIFFEGMLTPAAGGGSVRLAPSSVTSRLGIRG